MSSITEIRAALAAEITTPGWRVHPYVDENMETPAVVVRPKSGRVDTNRRGVHTIEFELVCVTSQATSRTGQAALDDLIAAVYATFPNGPLAGLTDTSVFVSGWEQDREITIAGNDVFAAVFDVTVTTEGLI